MAAKRVIFLDKDGTLIPDIPYNVDPKLISLSPDAVYGLQQLQLEGYSFIIVSNQSGIAEGKFGHAEILAVWSAINDLLSTHGIILIDFYYCPHSAAKMKSPLGYNCDCRKPKPGLLFRAAREHSIDLSASWMIGDILNDVEAGNAAGCKTILINNGNETKWEMNDRRTPDIMVSSINAAADFIVKGYE